MRVKGFGFRIDGVRGLGFNLRGLRVSDFFKV